jgi:hypothetical protein
MFAEFRQMLDLRESIHVYRIYPKATVGGIALDQAPPDATRRKTLGKTFESTNDSRLVSPASQKPAWLAGAIAAVLSREARTFA